MTRLFCTLLLALGGSLAQKIGGWENATADTEQNRQFAYEAMVKYNKDPKRESKSPGTCPRRRGALLRHRHVPHGPAPHRGRLEAAGARLQPQAQRPHRRLRLPRLRLRMSKPPSPPSRQRWSWAELGRGAAEGSLCEGGVPKWALPALHPPRVDVHEEGEDAERELRGRPRGGRHQVPRVPNGVMPLADWVMTVNILTQDTG